MESFSEPKGLAVETRKILLNIVSWDCTMEIFIGVFIINKI